MPTIGLPLRFRWRIPYDGIDRRQDGAGEYHQRSENDQCFGHTTLTREQGYGIIRKSHALIAGMSQSARIDPGQKREQTAMLTVIRLKLGGTTVPTDLGVASERKRKAAQVQAQTETTILLALIMFSLVALVLLVADQGFAIVTTEVIAHLGP